MLIDRCIPSPPLICSGVPPKPTLPQSGSRVDGNWTLFKMTTAATTSGAVCLDGSPAAYYLRQPLTPSTTNRWVIFMEGGGWCMGDLNCYQRSLTDLGSSKNYPTEITSPEGQGLFDQFATATIVYVKYCCGGSFTGDVEGPIAVGNATIYYRGRRILDGLLDELFGARGLADTTELLFSGCSAGALTTYLHADYVTARMAIRAPTAKVVALADAMFSLQSLDFQHSSGGNYYTRQFTWGYTAWNASASINQDCRAAHPSGNTSWMCFHGAIAANYVKTPLFVANSK